MFFNKPKSFIGIDIGSSSIKMIELSQGDKIPKLVTYGYAENLGDITRHNVDNIENQKQIAEIITRIYKIGGFSSRKVITALHNFSVFSSVINLPRIKENELASSVILEAKKFIPIPLEDVILDWKIINKEENKTSFTLLNSSSSKKQKFSASAKISPTNNNNSLKAETKDYIEVLITVAPKKLVRRHINIFKLTKLDLVSVETESFALARALLYKDKQQIMILDIGDVASDIIIIENGVPVISRSIDVGGSTITQAIAKSLNVNNQRAEQFKRDIGISGSEAQASIYKVIETAFSPVLNEARYSIELYKSREKIINKIILSGGSALLNGLADFISKFLNLKVYIGNPWEKVAYPAEIEPILTEIGPRFTISIGLALREILQ